MENIIKGIKCGRKVTEADFKKEIIWNKVCPCCLARHGESKKEYSADDMVGNAVKVSLLNIHPRTNALYGHIHVLCDDCLLLYTWKTL